ncbi:hypothetical protein LTR82_011379 [Friedmanniomyces endolithicus]|uniref:SpvB-domain-containing protein n=1 Tax=Friedmanniomyces endolithicus TaxID=329885 RepID=A0AAN6FI44_9PEZI|nr:hypothetical protein LTR82_011379 [Friedmanniomyces endolithicus]
MSSARTTNGSEMGDAGRILGGISQPTPSSSPFVASPSPDIAAQGEQAANNSQGSAYAPGSSGTGMPPVKLPSGGGAIRGMGENVHVNAANGTATVTIPIPVSKARMDMKPELSLQYSSGGGQGPYGMGWDLAGLPEITRSTRHGLPMYDDEVDTFVLSGGEDLVPCFKRDEQGAVLDAPLSGEYVLDQRSPDQTQGFWIRQYRPRIDGSYSRIERWTDHLDPEDVHWRVFTPVNTLLIFGRSAESRIMSAPTDTLSGARIFTWLCCEAYDCFGNAISYEYKVEDSAGVDLSQAHERNRSEASRQRQRYLKRVRYGNSLPLRGEMNVPALKWLFELVFDFGEHDLGDPLPVESVAWQCRQDPTSTYQAGFEVRTYRLCRRVLMFHQFEVELGRADYLVKALELTYREDPAVTYLETVKQAGFVLRKPQDPVSKEDAGPYFSERLPALDFRYQEAPDAETLQRLAVHEFPPDDRSLANVPTGLQGSTQWTDLLGEGANGILSTSDEAWYYKRNMSAASFRRAGNDDTTEADASSTLLPAFGPLEIAAEAPKYQPGSGLGLMDLQGDGQVSLVANVGGTAGFYRHPDNVNDEQSPFTTGLQPFQPFNLWPVLDTADANLRFVDLTGDGKADILITQDDALVWYEGAGEDGFAQARRIPLASSEEAGPRVLFSDPRETIYLADMSGDGLPDIVRIRNSDICYWPNLAYGHFGAKVTMDDSPVFDTDVDFNQHRLLLGDVDGSGTTDLIYCLPTGAQFYANLAGNRWAAAVSLDSLLPFYDSLTTMTAVDMFGTGTMCLVLSSSHPEDTNSKSISYVDLTNGQKPHLLRSVINNAGKETSFEYCPSTAYYFEDLQDGNPWATRLPYPQHCLDKVVTRDQVSQITFTQRYRYRHGFYDGIEKEFRGFGMVEQWDSEQLGSTTSTTPSSSQGVAISPPMHTKTWFHTGAFEDHEQLARAYEAEYYTTRDKSASGSHPLEQRYEKLSTSQSGEYLEELREASRTFKGSTLRTEVYADDGSALARVPYSITEYGHTVRMLQPQGHARYAVFQIFEREQLIRDTERDDADPRVQHLIKLEVDSFGNDVQSCAINYARKKQATTEGYNDQDHEQQATTRITYSQHQYTNSVFGDDAYRLPKICMQRSYELPADLPTDQSLGIFTPELLSGVTDFLEVPFDSTVRAKTKRLLSRSETFYRNSDLSGDLAFGKLDFLALPGSEYVLCLTETMVSTVRPKLEQGTTITDVLRQGGYSNYKQDGNWWVPTAQSFYTEQTVDSLGAAQASFFSPTRSVDEFGSVTMFEWDTHFLECVRVEDQVLHNITTASIDYRTLQLQRVVDINGNIQEVHFDALGMVAGLVISGKDGEKVGDTFEDFRDNLSAAEVAAYFDDPDQSAPALLAGATMRFIYDLSSYSARGREFPTASSTIVRTVHHSEEAKPSATTLDIDIAYFDGHDRATQHKARAEGSVNPNDSRWRGSGWIVLNNKGQPVQTFEPFFDASHAFQFDRRVRVSTFHVHDGLGREVAVLLPNMTWTKMVRASWTTSVWDTNDTVLASITDDEDVGYLVRGLPKEMRGPSWLEQMQSADASSEQKLAATKTKAHANTPTLHHVDVMGRTILTVHDNGSSKISSRVEFDISGNVLQVSDGLGKAVAVSSFTMDDRPFHTTSPESGERWTLTDIHGKALLSLDARGNRVRSQYDTLRRLTDTSLSLNGKETVVQRNMYGEGQPDDIKLNLRGKLFRQYDQAGMIIHSAWDFKGNELQSDRAFALDYKSTLDCSTPVAMQSDFYTTRTVVDARNRVLVVVQPDGSTVKRSYNRGGYLESTVGTLKGDATELAFLSSAEYDEYGRPVTEVSGNGSVTKRAFEKLTGRLATMSVRRKTGTVEAVLQALTYTYDPEGNTIYTLSDAEQAVFFKNAVARPRCEYTYDPMYRLIEAKGRENLGPSVGSPSGPETSSLPAASTSPADASHMAQYVEQYEYDAANNLMVTRHQYDDPKISGWTRNYTYETVGGVARSNRLVSASVGATTSTYSYDMNGNLVGMSELKSLDWDYQNHLRSSSPQGTGVDGSETTWYCYDSQGARVRKVTERQSAAGGTSVTTKLKERLIIGGYDMYREFQADGIELSQQCITLKVSDAEQLDVLVEQWTTTTKGRSAGMQTRLVRFQYSDYVHSVYMELDEAGAVVSYNEYTPYGSTTHRSLNGHAPKRFGFAGKELDGEDGLIYFGRRYYAPWLARWISPDPIGLADGLNVYEYVVSNPLRYHDPHGTCKVDGAKSALAKSHTSQIGGVPMQAMFSATAIAMSAMQISPGRERSSIYTPSSIRPDHFSGAPVNLPHPFIHPGAAQSMTQHFRQSTSMQRAAGVSHSSIKNAIENTVADIGGFLAGEGMTTALGGHVGQMAGSTFKQGAASVVPITAALAGGFLGSVVIPYMTDPGHKTTQAHMTAHTNDVSSRVDLGIGVASAASSARSAVMEPNWRLSISSGANFQRTMLSSTGPHAGKLGFALYGLSQHPTVQAVAKAYMEKGKKSLD